MFAVWRRGRLARRNNSNMFAVGRRIRVAGHNKSDMSAVWRPTQESTASSQSTMAALTRSGASSVRKWPAPSTNENVYGPVT